MSRDAVFPALILAVLLLGPAWTRFAGQKFFPSWKLLFGSVWSCIAGLVVMPTVLIAACLHALLQFLPWLAYGAGWVDQEAGLPWECHLAYAVALVLAAPFLSAYFLEHVRDQGQVPVLGQCLEPGGGDI